MPSGYLVSLGADGALGVDDVIGGAWTSFATDTDLGSGQWVFTGVDGGTSYTDTLEPGQYYHWQHPKFQKQYQQHRDFLKYRKLK